jgi:hypothetical protein
MSRATLTGYYATGAEGGDIKRLDEKILAVHWTTLAG